jgi:hypothetical protein
MTSEMAFAAPGGAGAAQVLVREVEDDLVVRVRVDRRHEALDDAELLQQHLRHGGEAVRGAGGVGDHGVGDGVVLTLVDAHDDGDVLVLRRRRDDDLLRAGVDVRPRLGRVREVPGGLDDDVRTELLPGQRTRVALGEDAEGGAADGDLPVAGRDLAVEAAEDRVVAEQVRQRLDVGEVVDADDLDVGAGRQQRAEVVAADAAEAVDANPNGHGRSPPRRAGSSPAPVANDLSG